MSLNPLSPLTNRYQSAIRNKAIERAKTRVILAGRVPEDFSPDDLEVVVSEEEQKIKSEIRDKGLLAVLALLGLSFFG